MLACWQQAVARQRRVFNTPNHYLSQSRHDEATAKLSPSARQDYFRLREMIVENKKQVEYLQQYIKTQCQFH
nr:lysis system i-spanin subunit Rz [Arsenophonus endosymbiont of Aleurodicus floccissimus]